MAEQRVSKDVNFYIGTIQTLKSVVELDIPYRRQGIINILDDLLHYLELVKRGNKNG